MRKNKRVCILMALLFSFLCFPSDKVLAASNMTEVPLTIKQSFEIKNPAKEMDFTGNYEFCALDVDSPMPEAAKEGVYAFSLNGERAKTTISLPYLHAGVYHYRLVQTTKDKEFYQYDRSCYDITVYVKNGENGELIPQIVAQKEDGKKYGKVEFQNSYHGKSAEISKPSNPKEPIKTGDQANVTLYILVSVGAFLLMLSLLCFKGIFRKNNRI